jgi:hypothetical protein
MSPFTLTYVLFSVGVPLLAFAFCLIPGHIHEPE